jgi:hypothetical protein
MVVAFLPADSFHKAAFIVGKPQGETDAKARRQIEATGKVLLAGQGASISIRLAL